MGWLANKFEPCGLCPNGKQETLAEDALNHVTPLYGSNKIRIAPTT